jgi:hypothetical protein
MLFLTFPSETLNNRYKGATTRLILRALRPGPRAYEVDLRAYGVDLRAFEVDLRAFGVDLDRKSVV